MRYFLAIFVLAIFTATAFCEETSLEGITENPFEKKIFAVSAGGGAMRGDTTYQIGGVAETTDGSFDYRFPISELVFPLNLYYGSLGGEVNLFNRFQIEATARKNISGGSGKMEDSDWGGNYYTYEEWTDPDSLDTYSESDIDADAFIGEVSARCYLYEVSYKKSSFAFFLGAKYIYQKFEFTASNLDQWYPSLDILYGHDEHDRVSGEILTYEVTKKIPAALAGVGIIGSSMFTLDMEFGYSPEVTVEDEDNHILRDKISLGACNGDAFLFALTGHCRFHDRLSLNLRYDYTSVETEGDQKQYFDTVYYGTIKQKNFSDLQTFEVALSFLF